MLGLKQKSGLRSLIWVACLALQLPVQAGVAFEPPRTNDPLAFTVSGVIRFYSDPSKRIRSQRSFEMSVNNCRWFARINLNGAGETEGASDVWDHFEVYNQDDAIVSVAVINALNITNRAGNLITNQVTVSRGHIPFGGVNHITPIWLAYASSCFRQQLHENRMKRFYTLSATEFSLTNYFVRFESRWHTSEQDGPPVAMSFYNEGRIVIPAPNGGFIERSPLPPYSGGYLDALYEVSDYFSDAPALPKRLALHFFSGVPGAVTNTQLLNCGGYEVESFSWQRMAPRSDPLAAAHEISAPAPNNQMPEPSILGKPAVVYDSRIPVTDGSALHYLSTDGVKATNDLAVQRALATRNAIAARKSQTQAPAKRAFILGIIAATALTPLFFLARRYFGAKTQLKLTQISRRYRGNVVATNE